MGKIERLIKASEQVQLPEQETYVLSGGKLFYLMQAGFAALVLFFTNLLPALQGEATNQSSITMYINIACGLYGLAALVYAFTCKVIIDDEKMVIPGGAPFTKETLIWDNVKKAQIVGTITYRSYISLILKKLLSFFFLNIELHVTYRDMPGSGGINFPVFDRVANRSEVLYLIRKKLGDRLELYEKE